ncbi:MAG: DNA polymerase III subunit beta [Betaproteobacteria bacterium HGW-Betaproteobacteria-22]|nr:MAG: DNA polymerase III subunit beta [Betaproteobacteria bacterium HGW-Betaproteobacteria-22]
MHNELQIPIQDESAIKQTLLSFAEVRMAIIFGSLAKHKATFNSDLDIAILVEKKISPELKLNLINSLASRIGRPVDLIDLNEVGEPLLGEILQHGKMIIGNATLKGNLLTRHLMDLADFVPYQTRILKERRNAWINS